MARSISVMELGASLSAKTGARFSEMPLWVRTVFDTSTARKLTSPSCHSNSSSDFDNLRPGAFDNRQQFFLVINRHAPLVERGLQITDGSIEFGVGDVHAFMGILHFPTVVTAGPTGGQAQKLRDMFLEHRDVLDAGVPFHRLRPQHTAAHTLALPIDAWVGQCSVDKIIDDICDASFA